MEEVQKWTRTSSVDQQHHLPLFGVFLQDSLDLKGENVQLLFLMETSLAEKSERITHESVAEDNTVRLKV